MMLNKRTHFWLFAGLAAIALTGCAKPAEKGGTSPPGPTASNGAPAAAPDPATVPAAVKHDGFQYYGLDRAKPIEYEVVRSDTGDTTKGTASTRLIRVDDNVAAYMTERTGALSELGAEEVEARSDGIYNVKIGGKPVEPVQLVMPASLEPGKTWQTKSAVELDAGKVEEELNFKVVGTEKLKTKAGEFDALKVAASGQFKVGEQVAKAEVTAWYVKGIGTVKMSIVRRDPSGKPLTMTVEATKVD